ncbi:thioredoxin domain-containing protein [Hominimerdicola sp. 21CYCFAH17_S]
MSNKLKNETSPYLLQHAENPVEWYPWGEEAFEKAKSEDKPVFLSIGYSTCHWCHVMAHESFENQQTAAILNKNFISVKVDREERPDIDSVYMSVCQALTGSGGWPMSIFMSWDKKPFFAGTYFPPKSNYGMTGFPELLTMISEQWKNNRSSLMRSASEIISHLERQEKTDSDCVNDPVTEAAEQLENSFDEVFGGFGNAPKFPVPHNLLFLMLYAEKKNYPEALKMAEKTLTQMRMGGIFDHIGSGFSRYSTDRYFLAPHFEKMLYDNALLIIAYSAAYRITGRRLYLDTAEKTAQYILREMTSPEGGFYSAQDADSEGVEGRFYTFTLSEIIDALGEERGRLFAKTFDITAEGNFEGVNIPNLLKHNELTSEFSKELSKLYAMRKKRFKLYLDDKILLSWNSLMTAAMSVLYRASKNPEYLAAAEKAHRFIENNLCSGNELYTSFRSGKHSSGGILDDYSFYIAVLIELYCSAPDILLLEKAELLCSKALEKFSDRENGGFYLCDPKNSELIINPKEIYDGAIPSGNSVMAYSLVRLYQITEKDKYREEAEKQFDYMMSRSSDHPSGHCMLLLAKLLYDDPPEHISIAYQDKPDLKSISEAPPFLANITLVGENEKYPLINNKTTYYICRAHSCRPPVNEYQP